MDLTVCPLPAMIPSIAKPTCAFRFDQIVALIFQRRQPTATPPFATAEAMKTLAAWAPFFLAENDTKAVITPIITSWVFPGSEALVTGGNDNSTFNGIREYNGEGSVIAQGNFKNLQPEIVRELRNLSPESLASAIGISNLTVYFVNKNGVIFHNNLKGFPVYNFSVGSRGSEGLNAPDINRVSIDLPPYWDENLGSVTPDFNPLVELSNTMTAPAP